MGTLKNRSFSQFYLLRMIPMVSVMGIIFFLSHQPGDSLYLPSLPGIDKLAHMVVYAVLAGAIIYAFPPETRAEHPLRVVVLTVVMSFGYGVSDEFHQSFVVNRFVSGLDVLADCGGAVVTCALWLLFRTKN